jgi:hypothetical protein
MMQGANIMMEMRWWNWVGLAMLVIVFFSREPIWLFVSSNIKNIMWVIGYIVVAAVLLMVGGPDRDEP